MSRALRELDRADAQARQRGTDPLHDAGRGPRDWSARTAAPAEPRSHPSSRAVRVSPVFAAFVTLAVAGGALAWTHDPRTLAARFGVFVLVVSGWVVALSLHEFAHAYVGYRAGDHDAKTSGYLTLNPFRYLHPILSVVLPLLFIAMGGIGLPGGAVALHPHRFASRAWRSAVSAAGPAANLLVAGTLFTVIRVVPDVSAHLAFWSGLALLAFLQLSVAVLNLLPIPGLDGWGIVEPYVRPQTAAAAEKVKPWGMFALVALLMLRPVAALFFTVCGALTAAAGVPAALWQVGGTLLRFWQG